ncbi:MAG: L-histidine N(alpha)-methyltransferase [Acidobacteria bacterium]|nr:L-histidine N(alpha)-methyltransferase [Acidobacteriota bacterium]
MATSLQTLTSNFAAPTDWRAPLIQEVRRGLARRPLSLAPWLLYDGAGSRLFDRITTLPEYYPTRTERAILTRNVNSILAAVLPRASQPLRIIELGAGSADKTGILLDAALRAKAGVHYRPLDVSAEALHAARRSIERLYPGVRVEPSVVNYVTNPPRLQPFPGNTLVLYLGSSIANFPPEEARAILRNASSQMRPRDAFLLGVDLVKDESTLVAAYDDRAGVTAAFNLNVLHRLNRELGADFDVDGFRHRAEWNAGKSRIEMHLESTRDQQASIPAAAMQLHIVKGETIHTESSYKFTDGSVKSLLQDAGLALSRLWKDEAGRYAVALAYPETIRS